MDTTPLTPTFLSVRPISGRKKCHSCSHTFTDIDEIIVFAFGRIQARDEDMVREAMNLEYLLCRTCFRRYQDVLETATIKAPASGAWLGKKPAKRPPSRR